ncbi:MAG: orotidine-5'-phosphate decarboxylase [Bdellovibrionales bacterium]
MKLRNPIFVALDLDDPSYAIEVAQELKEIVGGFKVGPRLVMRGGSIFVQKLSQLGSVFVDMKHFDIPSTMSAALNASFDDGASFVTVHALSGRESLMECVSLENHLSQQRPFRVLAVTVLTSWSESSYPPSFKNLNLQNHVTELARFTLSLGLKGLVCSAHELGSVSREHFKVVPGIRLSEDSKDDQHRVLDPVSAVKAGAQMLVVGRPILNAPNIKAKAQQFVELAKTFTA